MPYIDPKIQVVEAWIENERLAKHNEQLRTNNKWLVDRLRDAVNVCYGGVTHEEIDTHEHREIYE